jgi:hypothetical protein
MEVLSRGEEGDTSGEKTPGKGEKIPERRRKRSGEWLDSLTLKSGSNSHKTRHYLFTLGPYRGEAELNFLHLSTFLSEASLYTNTSKSSKISPHEIEKN